MTNLDDCLQQQLDKVEQGMPLETVLSSMPGEAAELQPLVRLAAAVREVPHPEPGIAPTRVLAQKLKATAQGSAKPQGTPTSIWGRLRWPLVPGLAGLALVFLCSVLLLGSLVWAVAWPQTARAATLVDVVGKVEVASSGTSANWHPVTDGDKVYGGQRLRTQAGASATLVFFEGSRTTVGPSADLTLTRVDGSRGNVLRVALQQAAGQTSNSVVPLRGHNSQFVVNTPAGAASVHGTTFSVAVDPLGGVLFTVEAGRVVVTNDNKEVAVTAGQATRSRPNVPPETPAYQFMLDDRLTVTTGEAWVVAGVSFQVTEQTEVKGNPRMGTDVIVRGRIVDGQTWVADSIEPSSGDAAEFQFTGVVQAIVTDTWKINGVTVLVNEATETEGPLAVGDAVKVTYTILEGDRWLALEIKPLEIVTPPAAGSTVTPTLTAVGCTGQEIQPKGQELAQKYDVTYETIMGWFCQNFGFGEIDLAYSLSQTYDVPVADIFALRRSGLGWGEVKHHLALRPTPTITSTATLTPTATLTLTATLTPTLTVTPTVTSVITTVTDCTGANPQPKGQALATQYGVSYTEIMGWFCQGFGFGEIDQAYALSAQTGTDVSAIFTLKHSGLGWGEIKKQLTEPKAKPTSKPKKP